MQENRSQQKGSNASGTSNSSTQPVQAIVLHYEDTRVELTPGSPAFYLGRRAQSDMPVNQKFASRNHARIEHRDEGFVFVDQSKNGSFIKTMDGKEYHLLMDEMVITGSGFISLGCPVTDDNPHLISFFSL